MPTWSTIGTPRGPRGGNWLVVPLVIFRSVKTLTGVFVLIVFVIFCFLAVHFVHEINGSNREVAVEDDARGLANAEIAYRSTHPTYTDSKSDLFSSGFAPPPDINEVLLAGANGATSFCIIGAETSTATAWYLFNSSLEQASSINPFSTYGTLAEAEAACPLTYRQVNGPAVSPTVG